MKTEKTSRGGARPGSGRKPLVEGEALAPVTIKMSATQREKLARLGGAPWVRQKIDKAKLPKE